MVKISRVSGQICAYLFKINKQFYFFVRSNKGQTDHEQPCKHQVKYVVASHQSYFLFVPVSVVLDDGVTLGHV